MHVSFDWLLEIRIELFADFYRLSKKFWGAPQFAAFEVAADEIAARNWPPCKMPTI